MNARKLIIDCDPGIDDSLALMLAAASKELDLVGITTVSGNVPASMGAKNALKILSMIGKPDVPVYVGEETPLVRDYVDAMDTHGMDGLGESGWPDAEGLTPNKDAVSFLIETLKATPDVTILALGPMTNLAKVISRAPECLTNLTALVSMGGSYKSHGNPFPKRCTSFCSKSTSVMFRRSSSVTRHPVLYSISIMALSLSVSHAFLTRSSSIPDSGFLCARSYLIALMFRHGLLPMYPSLAAHSRNV